jgi:hypothetical protein
MDAHGYICFFSKFEYLCSFWLTFFFFVFSDLFLIRSGFTILGSTGSVTRLVLITLGISAIITLLYHTISRH